MLKRELMAEAMDRNRPIIWFAKEGRVRNQAKHAVNGYDTAIERRLLLDPFQLVLDGSRAIEPPQHRRGYGIFLGSDEVAKTVAVLVCAVSTHRQGVTDHRTSIVPGDPIRPQPAPPHTNAPSFSVLPPLR